MNTLSWLIYAGELAGNLKDVAGILALFGTIPAGMMIWFGIEEDNEPAVRLGKRLFLAIGVVGVLALLAPSTRTIYMIAASEMGERVAAQPETKEMLGDLREAIAKQIKKLAKEPTP